MTVTTLRSSRPRTTPRRTSPPATQGTDAADGTEPPRANPQDARTRELLATVRTTSSEATRSEALEEAVRLHMPLARALAHRYAGRGLERDDLEQVAYLALMKALSRFDLERETEFGAFATPTITGELRRHFRDVGWLVRPPRELQERRQAVVTARSRLEQDLGREPTNEEIAADLRLTTALVREAQVASANLRPGSLDATTADGSQPLLAHLEARGSSSDEAELDQAIVVRQALGRLPAREQRILQLRYTHDCTQAEIATEVGMSSMQVSRILRRVLERLRNELGSHALSA